MVAETYLLTPGIHDAQDEGFLMATFCYAGELFVQLDDHTLAHLQAVIGNKLRRGESFFFAWSNETNKGTGGTTVWLNPTIPLTFTYDETVRPPLNRAWIEALSSSANSNAGLQLTPEPPTTDPVRSIQNAPSEGRGQATSTPRRPRPFKAAPATVKIPSSS